MKLNPRDRWIMGGGTTGLTIVAALMLVRFFDPAEPVWDAFLVTFVIGLLVAVFFLQRYLRLHIGEVGEARFGTRNNNHG